MKRKTILTIELERFRVITKSSNSQIIFCEACGSTNEFVNTTEAIELAKLVGVTRPENFHFYQTIEKKLLVCLNSIFGNC